MMKIAIMIEKSNIPVRGITDRIGATIGSVTVKRNCEIGFAPRGSNHEMSALPINANCKTSRNIMRIWITASKRVPAFSKECYDLLRSSNGAKHWSRLTEMIADRP